jgi:hypothetical protein
MTALAATAVRIADPLGARGFATKIIMRIPPEAGRTRAS